MTLRLLWHTDCTAVTVVDLFNSVSLFYIRADIVVGAPFDGDGKVFIYRGSDSGIETKPAQVSQTCSAPKQQLRSCMCLKCMKPYLCFLSLQVLDGRDFDVRRFGYSISGGLDIDNNQYPDLAVGSLNDSVVLFRWDKRFVRKPKLDAFDRKH